MKRLLQFTIISIFFSLFLLSCSGEKKTFIKKWNVPSMYYGDDRIETNTTDAYFLFNPDSTYEEVGIEASDRTGSWELLQINEETKEPGVLQLHESTAPKEAFEVFKIEKYTADTIVLVKGSDDGTELRKEYLLVAEKKKEEEQ